MKNPNKSDTKTDFEGFHFFEKTISFLVDQPMFAKRSKSFYLGSEKISLIKSLVPPSGKIYASMVTQFKSDLPEFEKALHDNKLVKINSIMQNQQDKSAPSAKNNHESSPQYVYPIGSYCQVDLLDEMHISLHCLRRLKINSVSALNVDSNNSDITQDFFREYLCLDVEDSQINTNENGDDYSETSNTDNFIIQNDIDWASSSKMMRPDEKTTQTSSAPKKDASKSSDFGGNVKNSKIKTSTRENPTIKLLAAKSVQHVSENELIPVVNYHNLDRLTQQQIDYMRNLLNNELFKEAHMKKTTFNELDVWAFFEWLGFTFSKHSFISSEIRRLQNTDNLKETVEIALQILKKVQIFYTQTKRVHSEASKIFMAKRNKEHLAEITSILEKMAKGEKISPLEKLKKQFIAKKAPAHVNQIFTETYERLEEMDKRHPEFSVLKTFLEHIAGLPFGLLSPDNFDLGQARQILNDSHFGMNEVKQTILEFLAVGKLTGSLNGRILCLTGPPGVGKTSIAFSIAKALNRKSFRCSLGGENSTLILKGNRKTYVGSRPGRIVAGLLECQTENCVILLDEIDKLSSANVNGDPNAVLLEILDSEQNYQFVDNYLDFPIDLSKVLFICTANSISSIFPPLRDRMQVIQINGYTISEKEVIFNDYLVPSLLKEFGLENHQNLISISNNLVHRLIQDYCQEPGVRSLQKYTNRLFEKIAYQIVNSAEEKEATGQDIAYADHIQVEPDDLSKMIGPPVFALQLLYPVMVPGVVKSLSPSHLRGKILIVESSVCSIQKFKKGIKMTGSLSDTVKESIIISHSFARKFLSSLNNQFLENYSVHIHLPEGARPKDGASIGVAITSSLISLAINRPLAKEVAMTGEISLKGRVLRVSGIKEKLLAAKREVIKKVLIPEDNREDIEFLDQELKQDLNIEFVSSYNQVYKHIFD